MRGYGPIDEEEKDRARNRTEPPDLKASQLTMHYTTAPTSQACNVYGLSNLTVFDNSRFQITTALIRSTLKDSHILCSLSHDRCP